MKLYALEEWNYDGGIHHTLANEKEYTQEQFDDLITDIIKRLIEHTR